MHHRRAVDGAGFDSNLIVLANGLDVSYDWHSSLELFN